MLVALETVQPFFTADRTHFGESRAHGFYPEGKPRRQARVTNRTRPKVLGVDFVTTHSSLKKSGLIYCTFDLSRVINEGEIPKEDARPAEGHLPMSDS